MPKDTAHRRAIESFFADVGRSPDTVRVCRGLSCALNGGSEVAARAAASGATEHVYCVGYCDRAPALLLPDDTVLCGDVALAWPDGPRASGRAVDIRAVSRRAPVTERITRGSHADLNRARAAGVYEALVRALGGTAEAVLDAIEASGAQGRGGAGFPVGRKLRACATAPGPRRYVVANGDEGDPGSFVDRVLLEDDPHAVLEGLALCAFATAAREGVIFIRGEYPLARARMEQAIIEARAAGLLGVAILGTSFSFEVRVVGGLGSYVCGEETALLNAIEGRRGEVRVRPPYPVTSGLNGCPTAVNNIETLVNIAWIVREGAAAYRTLGTSGSPGTKAFCLNRGFARPGIVEAEFGLTLGELIEAHAGGARDGTALAAVAMGGPMGSIVTHAHWDIALAYDSLREHGLRLGHGGLVAIGETAALRDVLLNWVQFMADESCGKCVPCSRGSREALSLVRRWLEAPRADELLDELQNLMKAVEAGSLCGFGQGIAEPVRALARLALTVRRTRRA